MAGAKGRSGGRGFIPCTAELPPIGNDEDSICAYLEAVAVAITSQRLDRADADRLIACASEKRKAISQKNNRLEIEELYRLLADARGVNAAGRANVIADRQHKNAEGQKKLTD